MAGTPLGGQQAAETNKKKYGEDFYVVNGAKGGAAGNTGGFAAGEEGRERARFYGRIGGTISRKGGSEMDKARQAARRKVYMQHYDRNFKKLQAIAQKAQKQRQAQATNQ